VNQPTASVDVVSSLREFVNNRVYRCSSFNEAVSLPPYSVAKTSAAGHEIDFDEKL
jgi:hypothetical protein